MRRPGPWIAAALVLTFVSSGAAPARPRLAVVLVVDGLSWNAIAASRAGLRGGLGRLLKEGMVETGCKYRHFVTETATGHASLSTGAPPRVTGIVANAWFERAPAGGLDYVDAVSEPGTTAERGSPARFGPGRLLAPTLPDRLLAKSPDSRVVSISGKYRSAILLAGRDRRHSVHWLDPRTAAFVTAPYYDAGSAGQRAAARIVAKLDEDSSPAALEKRFGASWTRVQDPVVKFVSPTDLLRFQIPVLGRLFPHPLAEQRNGYAAAFYMSPYADEHLADLAIALLADDELALGRRDATDVLAVSFSTLDHLAHRYGPESAEAADALERIDRSIGRILGAIDEKLPKGAAVVALSADHGFLPIRDVRRPITRTEPGEDPGIPHGRVVLDKFPETLNRELDRSLCLDPATRPIRGIEKWLLYYDPRALPARSVEGTCGPAGREVTARDVDAALPAALERAFPGSFASVLLASDRARWKDGDPTTELARNNFRTDRSGDAFLVPTPGEMLHWDADTRGADHGSPHEYDRHVPMIFLGAAFPRGDVSEATTPYDLAPTLAKVVGVELPDAVGKSRVSAGTPRPR